MKTQLDNPAATKATQKLARVKFIGVQLFMTRGLPARAALYNIVSGDGLQAGTTRTRSSLHKEGFRLEVIV